MRTSGVRFGETWVLQENATLRLAADAAVVRVERGTVLVTQEGDPDDHVLERGDELELFRSGCAVAWAFTDAALSIHPAIHRLAA
jgi:hypothetical protein